MTIQAFKNELSVKPLVEEAKRAIFYIPSKAKDFPKQKGFEKAYLEYEFIDYVVRETLYLAKKSKGRAALFFNCDYSLGLFKEKLALPLEKAGLTCFYETEGVDKQQLVADFMENGKGVLFARTSSAKELNMPSDELSLVVLPVLPFPSKEVSEAKKAEMGPEADAYDVFMECSVNPALEEFIHVFNTLVKSKGDTGVFAVLDGRILSKKDQYGKYFLTALPEIQKSVERTDLTAALKKPKFLKINPLPYFYHARSLDSIKGVVTYQNHDDKIYPVDESETLSLIGSVQIFGIPAGITLNELFKIIQFDKETTKQKGTFVASVDEQSRIRLWNLK